MSAISDLAFCPFNQHLNITLFNTCVVNKVMFKQKQVNERVFVEDYIKTRNG